MITFSVKYTGEVSKAKWKKALKEAYLAPIVQWTDEFKMRHFTHAGAKMYGYEPRTAEYEAKKKRRPPGFGLPLVWSGASRTLASIRDIRSQTKGAKSIIHAVGLNRKPKGKVTSMREEMTRVTTNEQRSMVAVASKTLARELVQAQKTGTRKKKL